MRKDHTRDLFSITGRTHTVLEFSFQLESHPAFTQYECFLRRTNYCRRNRSEQRRWFNCVLVSLRLACCMTPIPLGCHRDHRNPSAPIRTHTSTHSEDINVLAFHPSKASILLSGSADGLLSISNALEDNEDEAVAHVGNWGCSISRAGWNMPAEEIWSHSDMETMATWNNEVGTLSLR